MIIRLILLALLLPALANAGHGMGPGPGVMTYSAGGGASVTDDFNRTNGGLGANWTTTSGQSAPSIESNTVTSGGAARHGAYYSGVTFSSNQKSCVKITTRGDSIGPSVRVQPGSQEGYYLITGLSGVDAVLRRIDGTTFTTIATYTTIIAGDVVCISANGSEISATKNGSSFGTAVTDTTYTGGSPGIIFYYSGTKGYLDDFEASDL